MAFFNFDNVAAWQAVEPGEVLQFDARGRRQIKLHLSASGPVEIWVGYTPDLSDGAFLVRHDGVFMVCYSMTGTSFFQARAAKGTVISMSGAAPDHRCAPRDLPAYTRIEPVPATSEFERMRMLMEHNERRRDRQLQHQLAELRAASAPPAAAEPAPAAAEPAPAAAASSDGGSYGVQA